MLGAMKYDRPMQVLHTSDFDYNDDMIATGAFMLLRIVEHRLNVAILGQK